MFHRDVEYPGGVYSVERVVQLQRKIAPDVLAVIEERYNILRQIQYAQPLGRRALAAMLGMGERIVRAQVDFLKAAGLVDFSPLGMTVTQEGRDILTDLSEYVRVLHGLKGLEEEISYKLNLKRVIIIPGDSSHDKTVQRELGRAAAGLIATYLQADMTIAVSGGSTMAMMAENIGVTFPKVTVVPTRGGLGERVEYQANTIAAKMATKLGGSYRLLHIKDGVSEEALEVIMAEDAALRDLSGVIKNADLVVYGIGEAVEMALRRGLDEKVVAQIAGLGAVGEALGQYCTLEGKIVYMTSSVGLRLDDLARIRTVIAVAGGKTKAEAIVAVANAGGQDVLITDEAAAKEIQIIINETCSGWGEAPPEA